MSVTLRHDQLCGVSANVVYLRIRAVFDMSVWIVFPLIKAASMLPKLTKGWTVGKYPLIPYLFHPFSSPKCGSEAMLFVTSLKHWKPT